MTEKRKQCNEKDFNEIKVHIFSYDDNSFSRNFQADDGGVSIAGKMAPEF